MKVIFDRDELIDKITPAMGAVSNKNTIDALEGILIKTESDNSCMLCAYDLEKGLRTHVGADVQEEGSYIINALRLQKILRVMPSGNLTITVDEKCLVKIKGGTSEFELHALNGEEFPKLPELSSDRAFSISPEVLKDMISRSSFCIAQNDQRPAFNGAFFKIKKNTLTIVSCDSFRLALVEKNCDIENQNADGSETDMSFIIPGKTLNELTRLLSDSDEKIKIMLARKHIIFVIDDKTFFSRLIDSEYVDYDRFIPKNNKIHVSLETEAFLKSLERAALITEDKTLGQAKSYVKCKYEGSLLKVSSVSVTGRVYDEIIIDKKGDDIEIGFNCLYLIDAIKACNTDRIKVSLSTPLMSMVIENEEQNEENNEKFVYLVLPVKMKD